jgi:hypothetical protein
MSGNEDDCEERCDYYRPEEALNAEKTIHHNELSYSRY